MASYPVEWLKLEKLTTYKCWEGTGASGTPIQTTLESYLEVSYKNKHRPAIKPKSKKESEWERISTAA